MIKVKISNFIKNNINKFKDLGIKLIIVAIVVFIATIILSLNRNDGVKKDENQEIYTPTETVIKGSNVSEKQYKMDLNIIDKFLEYCNNKKVEEAYAMISDECKENIYPTLDIFKESYYNSIFSEKKEYNLQSWISTNKYTVYKIRYTEDILSTGSYNENNVYQDYITLIKNSDIEKISIGSFINKEELNTITSTDKLEVKVIKQYIYLDYEEYIIQVKNNSENTILLDDLNTNNNIKLISGTGINYKANINKIFKSDLLIETQKSNIIKLTFKKEFSSGNKSEYIQFSNAIRNYNEYSTNSDNYNQTFSIKIKL